MAISKDQATKAMIAFHRFGLGPKPGGLKRIAADPKAALLAELSTAGIAGITDPTLPTYAKACSEGGRSIWDRAEAVRHRELEGRFAKQVVPEIGFVERLVMFWTNHFSMHVAKHQIVRATIGHWERAVVRRHVLGKFSDMMLATYQHPAMVVFLDNDQSIGPNSDYGYTRRVSYTENLAREALELHALGTGNYPEADVAALARILTGWSFNKRSDVELGKWGATEATRGQFSWRPQWHEKGPIKFHGRIFADEGLVRGQKALKLIATRAATAQHLAYAMVRHFIADQPTEAMVAPVRQAFIDTGGDLKAMATALVNLPEAWSTPANRLRHPQEFLLGMFRATGTRYTDAVDYGYSMRLLSHLSHRPWEAPSPEGYPDETDVWLTPAAMTMRVDGALYIARKVIARGAVDVPALARDLYGLGLSYQTRERIAYAGTPLAALTILFACPEFQRR